MTNQPAPAPFDRAAIEKEIHAIEIMFPGEPPIRFATVLRAALHEIDRLAALTAEKSIAHWIAMEQEIDRQAAHIAQLTSELAEEKEVVTAQAENVRLLMDTSNENADECRRLIDANTALKSELREANRAVDGALTQLVAQAASIEREGERLNSPSPSGIPGVDRVPNGHGGHRLVARAALTPPSKESDG